MSDSDSDPHTNPNPFDGLRCSCRWMVLWTRGLDVHQVMALHMRNDHPGQAMPPPEPYFLLPHLQPHPAQAAVVSEGGGGHQNEVNPTPSRHPSLGGGGGGGASADDGAVPGPSSALPGPSGVERPGSDSAAAGVDDNDGDDEDDEVAVLGEGPFFSAKKSTKKRTHSHRENRGEENL